MYQSHFSGVDRYSAYSSDLQYLVVIETNSGKCS